MKITVISPYFGSFNSYFNYWLRSCANNSGIDWLIITDQTDIEEKIIIPHYSNVHFVYQSFDELRTHFEKKLSCKIRLDKPYKLCDFKPLYGFLFQEFISDSDFWGYCDMDVIFGDILSLIPQNTWKDYDKIFAKGHLSFIRNRTDINENFFKYGTYKKVISSPAAYAYDEVVEGYNIGFAGELIRSGYRLFNDNKIVADIDFRHFPFYEIQHNNSPCIYANINEKLYRLRYRPNTLPSKEEIAYIHLQKRRMDVCTAVGDILICPNKIIAYDDSLVQKIEFWESVIKEEQNYYSKFQEKRFYIKNDILKFIYEPSKLESIFHRLKI